MNFERKLKKEREEIKRQLERLNLDYIKQQGLAGDMKIGCTVCRGVHQYRVEGKYYSKSNINIVRAVAQRDYDERMIKELEGELKSVEKMITYYEGGGAEKVYDHLCPGRRKIVTPIIEPVDEFVERWQAEKYEPYDRWEDVKTELYTLKGERVRSKAEKLIADELTHYNVPYKYEYPLEVMDGRQRKTLRPDFMTLNRRTRDEYVLEYLGMMDKFSYCNHNLDKLDVLERNGYMLGVNLLLFHETSESQLSILTVRRYIEEYLI